MASFVFSGDLIVSPAGKRPRFLQLVVETEFLLFASEVSCVPDVIVSKFFALTCKGTYA